MKSLANNGHEWNMKKLNKARKIKSIESVKKKKEEFYSLNKNEKSLIVIHRKSNAEKVIREHNNHIY